MLIGYARVSTDDQNLDLQRDALRLAGCEKIYEDRISGAKAARPGLAMALEVARAGDVLTVWRLDRLGRSLHDLILLGRKLDEMGIGLMSVQEKIDTSSSGGRLVFHMFGALAEFERNLVRERTQAGLNAARAQGRPAEASGSRQAAARGKALCREAAHDRRDLPDDGDLQTDALQLHRRSQRVTCGGGVPPTRSW
jgi:DNA invertase Pin-like site-specific DNA recombinase